MILERVYDQILENFNTREQEEFGQCHIINCDIVDNHEDATLGAIILSQLIEELVQHEGMRIKKNTIWVVSSSKPIRLNYFISQYNHLPFTQKDIDNDIDEVLQEFEETKKRKLMHTVVFY